MPNPKLLIATHNRGKMREYRHLLQDVPLELVSLDDLSIAEEIEETGESFLENAWLKAGGYAQLSGQLTLSDDSGLEVDALGGEPGIHSARYGGDSCSSDEERVQLLLRNLEGVPREKRTARFRCVIAICDPDGSWFDKSTTSGEKPFGRTSSRPFVLSPSKDGPEAMPLAKGVSVVGSVAGMIQYEPEGNEGFGYDPVFYLPSYGQTMSQIPLASKNHISHRSDATGKALAVLKKLVETGSLPSD